MVDTVFEGEVDFRGVRLDREVDLSSVTFQADVLAADANVNGQHGFRTSERKASGSGE